MKVHLPTSLEAPFLFFIVTLNPTITLRPSTAQAIESMVRSCVLLDEGNLYLHPLSHHTILKASECFFLWYQVYHVICG